MKLKEKDYGGKWGNKNRTGIISCLFVLIITLFLSGTSGTLDAQTEIKVNSNVKSQPLWGPAGYDYVEYYYLPDIDIYYNVPNHKYSYKNNDRWFSSLYLPARFRNYDFYSSYKVVINEQEPWRSRENYSDKYSSYKDRHDQQTIRDSKDSKYFVNAKHPEHKNWIKQQKHDNSNSIVKETDTKQKNEQVGNNLGDKK